MRLPCVRVWEIPVETFLNGGLGIVPLAPLSDVAETDLPGVVARMQKRIGQEATPEEAGMLWTATDVLMGLRYPRDLVAQLLQGVHGMKESVTYQAIVEEGVIRGAQDVLLRQGRKKFGAPNEPTVNSLRGITDVGSPGTELEFAL